MAYCFDTSSLIEAWHRKYPPVHFPSFWEDIDKLIKKAIIVSSEEVLMELKRKDDELYAWAIKRKSIFIPLDKGIQEAAAQILGVFPRLIDSRRTSSQADPFIIGMSMLGKLIVVTDEKNIGTPQRPRIPLVCSHFKVKWLNVLDLIKEQGWEY